MQQENKTHVQNLSPEATASMPTKIPYSWKCGVFKQNNFLRGEQICDIVSEHFCLIKTNASWILKSKANVGHKSATSMAKIL